MRFTQFLVLVLLTGSSVNAQVEPYGEVKSTALYALGTSPPVSAEPVSAQPVFAQPVSAQPISAEAIHTQPVPLPATPQPQRVIDKKFVVVMGALGLAEAMHFTTRTLVLEHEQAAGAPWVTSLPSHSHVVATDTLVFASELLVAYEMKKPHDWLPGDKIIRKLWWVYPVVMAVPHFKSATHNIRLQPPAGCTSPECQSH